MSAPDATPRYYYRDVPGFAVQVAEARARGRLPPWAFDAVRGFSLGDPIARLGADQVEHLAAMGVVFDRRGRPATGAQRRAARRILQRTARRVRWILRGASR
jgi:hypothetical protein